MMFSLFGTVIRFIRSLLQCINAFRGTMRTDQQPNRRPLQSDEDRIRVLALIIERAEARIAFQVRI
jgi:hypothetical protein